MFSRPSPKNDNTPPEDRPRGHESADQQDLAEQVSRLSEERDQAQGDFKRALADFQNFQRRAALNEQEAKRQGVTSVLGSVLPVLDHFDLALSQAAPDDSSRRILDGVKLIRAELVRALEAHGVKLISPQPNDEFDPNMHSAIMQQPAAGVKPGRVSSTFQPGYSMGDRVIRSAKVAVAPDLDPARQPDGEILLDE
ncbi:MAG: nucleotide exchange factor GrpE [Phycisphaerales bacterium]|nr:nucleotide exchange factor GrpE [Phycisphaerales bacterium]